MIDADAVQDKELFISNELRVETLFDDLEFSDRTIDVVTLSSIGDTYEFTQGTRDRDVVGAVWARLKYQVEFVDQRQLHNMDFQCLDPTVAMVALQRIGARSEEADVIGKFCGLFGNEIEKAFEGQGKEIPEWAQLLLPADEQETSGVKVAKSRTPEEELERETQRARREEIIQQHQDRSEVEADFTPDELIELEVIQKAMDIVGGRDPQRTIGMWALYTTLKTEDVGTIEMVGKEYGVTRERVRQVVKKVEAAIAKVREDMQIASDV